MRAKKNRLSRGEKPVWEIDFVAWGLLLRRLELALMGEGDLEHLKAEVESADAGQSCEGCNGSDNHRVFARYVWLEPEGEEDPDDSAEHDIEGNGFRRYFEHFGHGDKLVVGDRRLSTSFVRDLKENCLNSRFVYIHRPDCGQSLAKLRILA